MTTPRLLAFAWASAFGLMAVLASVAQANSFEYENYVFHYNALRTDELPVESTQKAGIVRSRNRGMINLALRQKTADGITIALPADVSVSAVNLNNQYRELTLREIRDGDAIYYISDFPISGQETLRFQVNVLPEGAKKPFKVQFEKQFFTDP